jgi:hypothetical protein
MPSNTPINRNRTITVFDTDAERLATSPKTIPFGQFVLSLDTNELRIADGTAVWPPPVGGGGGGGVPQNEFAFGGPGGVGFASSPNFVDGSLFGILTARVWRWFTDAGIGGNDLATFDATAASPRAKFSSQTHSVLELNLLDGSRNVRIGDDFRVEVDLEANLLKWIRPTNDPSRIGSLATGTYSTPAVNPPPMNPVENNYAPANGEFNRLTPAAGGTILSGLAAGRDGELKVIVVEGPNPLIVRNDNPAGVAGARILTRWATSVILSNPAVSGNPGVMVLRYDEFAGFWVQVNTPILLPVTVAVTAPAAPILAGAAISATTAPITVPEGAVYGLAAPAANFPIAPLTPAPWPSLQSLGGVGGPYGGNVISPLATQLRFTGFDSAGAGTALGAVQFNAEIVWMIAS